MSIVIAYLGERLRRISSNAQLSAARLSAYLNEVSSDYKMYSITITTHILCCYGLTWKERYVF